MAEREVEESFKRSIDDGRRRLSRRTWLLLATGLLGGIDVGTGVLALLVVEHETGNVLLAGLAFTIGFMSLSLARSDCSPRTSWFPSRRSSPAMPAFACCACGSARCSPTSSPAGASPG